MSDYLGMFELQPLNDGHKSFYGKAFVERWNTENGIQYVLKSYVTAVAAVTPVSAPDADYIIYIDTPTVTAIIRKDATDAETLRMIDGLTA